MKGIPILILFALFSFIEEGCLSLSPTESSNQTLLSIASLTATPDTIGVGELSKVVVVVTDLNGGALSYSWSADLGDLIPSSIKNEVFYTALPCCGGRINKVTVIVKDGRGGEIQKTVEIVVLL